MKSNFYDAIYVVVVLVGLLGWVFNVLNILARDSLDPVGLLLLQIIGVFVPFIGAILGYVI
jgi:hypothetical protein